MSATEDIKARLNIVDYVQQHVPLKKAGRYYKANCPFHAEKTPSFVVNEDTQSWRCFGSCAEGGDIFSFAMKYHGWDFKEALTELGKAAGVEVRKQTPQQKERYEHLDKLRGLLDAAADAYHTKLYDSEDPSAVQALRYARETRGLTDETIAAFGMGYAPPGWTNMLDHLVEMGYTANEVIEAGLASKSERSGKIFDRFRNRLLVPIRDRRGRVVGFGGRVLDPDDSPKYLNSPQSPVFDKSKLLFGLDLAQRAIRDSETAVIVEGYMDAISAHQAGYRNVVAQMGTAMTETQLSLIAPRWAKKVVLALDADAAGQSATRRSLETARDTLKQDFTGRLSVDMRVLQIPGAKDPDDLLREDPAQWGVLVDTARSVAEYVIDTSAAALPPNASPQQREATARDILPLLMATESEFYRQDNIQKLALRMLIPERTLFQWAAAQKQAAQKPKPRPVQPSEVPEDDGPPPRTDFGEAPDDLLDDDEVQDAVLPARLPFELSADTALEAHFLHILFKYPALFYHINRKFRELADGQEPMLRGPLNELCSDDLHNGGFRALMVAFLEALAQDELEPVDYIQAQVGDALHEELRAVMVDHTRVVYEDRTIFGRDAEPILAQMQRKGRGLTTNPRVELVTQALRLRLRRLQAEREQLQLIQLDAMQNGEHLAALSYGQQIALSARAKHVLDVELQRQTNLTAS